MQRQPVQLVLFDEAAGGVTPYEPQVAVCRLCLEPATVTSVTANRDDTRGYVRYICHNAHYMHFYLGSVRPPNIGSVIQYPGEKVSKVFNDN